MGRKDLIGGSLWEQYSEEVARRMNNPENRGEITKAEAEDMNCDLIVADWGAESCGDSVRLYWAVDRSNDLIKKSTFKSFGCGTAIASSDMMAELCVGKTVDEALKITNIDVEKSMRDSPDKPAVPPQKMHCSVMAYDVIKKAAAIYKGIDKEELDDDEIVCECAQVSLKTIEDVIRVNDLKTVEEITQYTKAGAFCKSCIRPGGHEEKKHYLVDILARVREEMEIEEGGETGEPKVVFDNLTMVQKIRFIEEILDQKVRPQLNKDKGDLELIDVKEVNEKIYIKIRYMGACMSCPSSQHGTLDFISNVLSTSLPIEVVVEAG